MRGRAVGVLQLAQLVALAAALHAPVIPLPASRASSISLANFAAAPHGTAVPVAAATPRRHHPPRLAAATPSQPPSAAVVIGSCLSLSIVSGSFYAWSMLLPSLQASLGVARAPLSAVFSLATVCFTAGTSLGALAVDKISPSNAILLIASVSAVGLLLAAAAATPGSPVCGLPLLALGWAAGFGSMSGLSYSVNAKISTSNLFAGRNGVVTGLLVAGRAAAPVVATPLVLRGLKAGGAAAALRTLAAFVFFALLPAAVALRGLRDDAPPPPSDADADADADAEPAAAATDAAATDWVVYLLWINLLLGSGPGLLCHGHAAPMLSMCGAGGGSLGALGVSGMAAGSVIGRMGGGVAIDIFSARRCMFLLPALCAPVVLGPLLAPASVAATFAALVACGLSYGINAVALPVICSRVFGPQKFGAAYGKVFTAWGLGGIVAPWLAGRLYDATGGYRAALIVSSVCLATSGVVGLFLPPESDPPEVR